MRQYASGLSVTRARKRTHMHTHRYTHTYTITRARACFQGYVRVVAHIDFLQTKSILSVLAHTTLTEQVI